MTDIRPQALDHVAIPVADVEASTRWYTEVLGLERRFADAWGGGPPVMIGAGDASIALFPGERTGAGDLLHIAFRLDRVGFDDARAALDDRGVQTRFADHDICHSVYLSDPDGHTIELTTYEVPGA